MIWSIKRRHISIVESMVLRIAERRHCQRAKSKKNLAMKPRLCLLLYNTKTTGSKPAGTTDEFGAAAANNRRFI